MATVTRPFPNKIRDDFVLQSARLYLRRFREGEASLLFELDSDPEVMRFISKGEPTPLARIETEILPRVLSYYTRVPTQGCWAAHLLSDGQFIGWFHLRADRIEPVEMELGYRLRRNAWGHGYATEGSRALIEKGFNEWGYEKICARTLLENRASRRVMEKAGLKFEKEFTYGLDLIPDWPEQDRRAVKYSVMREVWVGGKRNGGKATLHDT